MLRGMEKRQCLECDRDATVGDLCARCRATTLADQRELFPQAS